MKTTKLIEPFPTEKLINLDFGKVDGGIDTKLEDAFVTTNATNQFFQDRHSVIVGPMGVGKSALFKLVKNKSRLIKTFKRKAIVVIEETVSFKKIQSLISDHTKHLEEERLHQLLWKFHICVRVCETLSLEDGYPRNKEEREINKFLQSISSKAASKSILDKLIHAVGNFTLATEVAGTPISFSLSTSSDGSDGMLLLNIERMLALSEKCFLERGDSGVLILIDRIDKFVSGQEYYTQRIYIESLLEVNDDMSVTYPGLSLKIFLRSDLFARLDYGSLGYDKVNDVTLRLKWTDSELISFIAKRLFTALESEKLMNPETLIISTNLDGFGLKGLSILRFAPWIPYWIKKKILNLDNVNSERNSSFQETLSKAMVLKLFPREIKHLNEKGKVEEICFFKFLLSHFKDGHDIITPRNLLIFLKKVRDDANQYYIENNDQSVHVEKNKGNYEWSLFKKILVYRSYLEVKNSYMLNISKVDNDWTKYIVVFLQKRGNKTSFEYNWIKNITGLEDAGTESFIAYLCHIGFLKLTSHSANIKHRVYSVPIIYMPTEEASWSVS